MTRSNLSRPSASFPARSRWARAIKPNRLMCFFTIFSASSMRLEISTSCSRVRRGTWPICLRYIRTGSSRISSLASGFSSSSSSSSASFFPSLYRSTSEASIMSISIRRSRVRMRSSSSASVIPSGNASFRSSNVRSPCSFASLISSRMRLWISIAECSCAIISLFGLAGRTPMRVCPWAMPITRLVLSAGTFACLFRIRRIAEAFVIERRRSCFGLGRLADDRRMPPFRFECLAKIARLKILTETFDSLTADRQLTVGHAGWRKLGKFVELFLQVKDLFLQIHYVAGAELWTFYPILRHLELAAQHSLANPQPPFFHHRSSVGRHLLQQPRRNQCFVWRGECGHKRIERSRLTRAQVAFENADQNFRVRDLRENFTPILLTKKIPCFLVPQRQKTKHCNVVPRDWRSPREQTFRCGKTFAFLFRQEFFNNRTRDTEPGAHFVHHLSAQ